MGRPRGKRYISDDYKEDPSLGFSLDASVIDEDVMEDPLKLLEWLSSHEELVEPFPEVVSGLAKGKKDSSASSKFPKPAKPFPGKAKDCAIVEALDIGHLRESGLRCIDFRRKGGALWVVGDESISGDLEVLRKSGMIFQYRPQGATATGWKPGWWSKSPSPRSLVKPETVVEKASASSQSADLSGRSISQNNEISEHFILVDGNEQKEKIYLGNVLYVFADGLKTRVCKTDGTSASCSLNIHQVENLYKSDGFIRVHARCVVRRQAVVSATELNDGKYELTMSDGKRVLTASGMTRAFIEESFDNARIDCRARSREGDTDGVESNLVAKGMFAAPKRSIETPSPAQSSLDRKESLKASRSDVCQNGGSAACNGTIVRKKSPRIPQSLRFNTVVDGKVSSVYAASIIYVKSAGTWSEVFTAEGRYDSPESLLRFEGALKSFGFTRVHRQFVVRNDCVEKIVEQVDGTFALSIKGLSVRIPAHKSSKPLLLDVFGRDCIVKDVSGSEVLDATVRSGRSVAAFCVDAQRWASDAFLKEGTGWTTREKQVFSWQEIEKRFEKIKDHKPKASKKLQEIGVLLSLAYGLDPRRADEMWNYIIELNVADDLGNAKFYIAQVFNKVAFMLPFEGAADLVSRDPGRLRLLFTNGYDGAKLWQSATCFAIGCLRADKPEACKKLLAYMSEKDGRTDAGRSLVTEMGVCLAYAAKEVSSRYPLHREAAALLLNFLESNSDSIISACAALAAYEQRLAGERSAGELLELAAKNGFSNELANLIWDTRDNCPVDEAQKWLSAYLAGMSMDDPLPFLDWSDDSSGRQQIEYFASLIDGNNVAISKLLSYQRGGAHELVMDSLACRWIKVENWEAFSRYVAYSLALDSSDYPRHSNWGIRFADRLMDSYLRGKPIGLEHCCTFETVINSENLRAFIAALRRACEVAAEAKSTESLKRLVDDFEKRASCVDAVRCESAAKAQLRLECACQDASSPEKFEFESDATPVPPDLAGILFGISCDDRINITEAQMLRSWIEQSNYESDARVKVTRSLLDKVLEDGAITDSEEQDLLKLCKSIVRKAAKESSRDLFCDT